MNLFGRAVSTSFYHINLHKPPLARVLTLFFFAEFCIFYQPVLMQKLELRITLWEPANSETDLQQRKKESVSKTAGSSGKRQLSRTQERKQCRSALLTTFGRCALSLRFSVKASRGSCGGSESLFITSPDQCVLVFFSSGSRISAGILETQPHAAIIPPRRTGTHSH